MFNQNKLVNEKSGNCYNKIMNLSLKIPFEALYVMWKLTQAGFEAYIVGGAVRDLLLQSLAQLAKTDNDAILINDYDFTTNATPEQIQTVFSDSYYTNEFGTVGIGYDNLSAQLVNEGFTIPNTSMKASATQYTQHQQNSIINLAAAAKIHDSLQEQVETYLKAQQKKQAFLPPLEITTFRSEGIYSDFRRPDQIQWGDSVVEDLKRRDFTINAMALEVKAEHLQQIFASQTITNSLISLSSDQYQLVDQHHGFQDLTKQTITTVLNPDQRFQEDALRMLRAIRLACQLKFKIEPLTLSSIAEHANLIKKISAERIQQELLAILATDQPDRGIQLLQDTGLLQYIMPEIAQGMGVEQGGHHDTDVWTHALDSLKACPSPDPIVRLATLLHDVGKPKTAQVQNGQITFYNHELVSSRMADQIAQRLKLSAAQREKLFILVRHHMFHYQPYQSDAAIRRLIKRVGLEYLDDILAVREADRLGSGAKKTSWRLEELKQRIVEQLNQPFDTTDLAINGHDLMQELQLQPGPKLGEVLDQLTEKVLDQPELNTKEKLLAEAKKLV